MPIPNEFLAVFGQNDPQNVKTKTKFHSEGTSLRQAAYFELSCVQIGPRVCPGRDSEKLKTNKKIKSQYSFMSRPPRDDTADPIQTPFGRVEVLRDVITQTRFEVDRLRIVNLARGRSYPF